MRPKRLSYFWVRISPNRGEITIARHNPGMPSNQHRKTYRATAHNIKRLEDAIWAYGHHRPLYWTAYQPHEPEYSILFANY